MEIRSPKLFGSQAVLACIAYGFFLFFPTILAILVVSSLGLGLHTLLIPIMTVAAAAFFLPFGFGNPYVAKLAREFRPAEKQPGENTLVQLTAAPRIRSGTRAMLEDADDIGWLRCTDTGLVFEGDSVDLSVPFACITAVRRVSGGARGLFLYRTAVEVSGFQNFNTLTFAERSSSLLTTSRRTGRILHEQIATKLAAARPATGGEPQPS